MATNAARDPGRLERLRRRLDDERNVLARRIADAQRAADVTPEPGEDDMGAASEIVEEALSFGTRLTERQHAIDDALLRLERGEYGVCEVCGNPIEPERLEAEPTARLCEDDARRADRRQSPSL